jgi:glutamate:Na+ symporter, ESS family
MLIDFAIISVLLVVAQLLRARLLWARRWMIPSSMIAGGLALLMGPQALNLLPFVQTSNGQGGAQLQLSSYPGMLIVFVFATLLMGHRPASNGRWSINQGVRVSLLFNLGAEVGQYGLAALFGLAFLAALYPMVPPQFVTMLAAGFAGGYGTVAIFAPGFDEQGWADAQSVGFAFATIGMLSAVVGGMVLINIGARRGWTRFVRSPAELAGRDSPAFLPENEQSSVGTITVNPTALDPLAWHISLLGAVYGLTLVTDATIHRIHPGNYVVPQFALGMLIGAIVQFLLELIGYGKYVDRPTMRRLGSLVADFLVAFGVASIKLNVVWEYAGPIAVMSVFGVVYSVAFLFLGAWVFKEYWFEQSMFTYGWLTGVVGFSVALLRVVDPQLKSRTLEDYGGAYLIIGPAEMLLYPAIIWACSGGQYLVAGLLLTALAGILLAAARLAANGSTGVGFEPALSAESIPERTIG